MIDYCSYIPILRLATTYCIIFVGDVTEVDVYTVNDVRCTINFKQRINSTLNNEQMVIS